MLAEFLAFSKVTVSHEWGSLEIRGLDQMGFSLTVSDFM